MNRVGFGQSSFALKATGFTSKVNPDDAILALFAAGKQGVWYDPSDKSILFQDVAGTVPVTKDGDPVALMRDKSGNDDHAVQTVSTARPVYKTDGILHWLESDGVDDSFITNAFAAIPQPYCIAMSMFTTAILDFNFYYRTVNTPDVYLLYRGYGAVSISAGTPITIADSNLRNNALVSSIIYNGTQSKYQKNNEVQQTLSIGTNPLSQLVIGGSRSAGNFHSAMRLYGFIVHEDVANNDRARAWLATKSGVTL